MTPHIGKSAEAKRNRQVFIENFSALHRPLIVDPRHSSNVAIASGGSDLCIKKFQDAVIDNDRNTDEYYDATVCSIDNYSIALTTADCLPVLFLSSEHRIMCLAHIGLLGLVNNISKNILTVMQEIGVDKESISVFIGPSISTEDYCIEDSGLWKKLESQFVDKAPFILSYVTKINGKNHLDFTEAFFGQIIKQEIIRTRIFSSDLKTDGINYFSHCRAKINPLLKGNFLTMAGLTS